MSSISATGLSLSSFFQGASVGANAQTTQAAATSSASGTDPTSTAQSTEGHHHHHGSGGSFGKIEQAVTSALQSAQSNSSEDPNTIIKDAIAKVLQSSTTATSATTTSSATPADSDGDADTGATDQTDANGQGFTALLQSLGVNPQEFHSDFLAAVQAAQGGQVDPSTALQSFPPGTTVDTTA